MSISDGILSRFGRDIVVSDKNGDKHARGFISPLNIRDTDSMCSVLPAGVKSDIRYLLICSAQALADGGCGKTVTSGGYRFELLRAEPVYFAGELSHWEGILRLAGRAENV